MRRLFLALVALVGFGSVAAHADYFIIKVNLAAVKDPTAPPAVPGGYQQPGYPGRANPGDPEGGMAFGAPPGGGGRPGVFQRPAPGRGFGGPGRGAPANRDDGDPTAGGAGFMGPGGTPRGYAGRIPQGPQTPGAAMITNTADDEEEDSAVLPVGGIVEARKEDIAQHSTGRILLKHKIVPNGKTTLFVDDSTPDSAAREIDIIRIDRVPTVGERYAKMRSAIKESDPDRVDKIKNLADFALTHGLIDEVPKIIEKELAAAEPKEPLIATFKKVEAVLAKDPGKDDGGIRWREKLGNFKEERSKHYVLCYDVPKPELATSRINRLEENLRGVYYWFALRGKVLPAPDRRLVAFLLADKDIFENQHRDIFDDNPLFVDGYYDRKDNMIVFSASCLDEGYQGLRKILSETWKKSGWDSDSLLHGRGGNALDHPNEKARAQTLTLVYALMRKESESVSSSFEGTQQLMTTLGYLPRGVETPKWFRYGLVSFFETPKGAFWKGTGQQNQVYLSQWKAWYDNEDKKSLEKPGEVLRHVVSDQYFKRVHDPKHNKENSENKARTMAWSLMYYLAQNKLDGVLRYSQEVAQMPRDVELSEDILVRAFAKAFDLADPAHPDKVDVNKWNLFANEWFKDLRRMPVEVDEVRKAMMKRSNRMRATATPGAKPAPGRNTEAEPFNP